MRVLCLGLDAATFDLITPWVEQGSLPNLARLMREGSHGVLESVQPPFTALAWPSFLTGKNPGKHGVYGFKGAPPLSPPLKGGVGGVVLPFSTARSLRCKTIAHWLSQWGKQVILLNVPLTYPPFSVNGLVVSGRGTPGTGAEFTSPPELKEEILRLTQGRYIIDLHWAGYLDTPRKMRAALQDLFAMIDTREQVARHLMRQYPWDFFMVVFMATDQVQHYFWHHLDPSHPQHDPRQAEEFGPAILRVYQRLDAAVGSLLEEVGEETLCLIASDHGAGPLFPRTLHLNEWLRREGLLMVEDGRDGRGAGPLPLRLRRWGRQQIRRSLGWGWRQLSRHLSSRSKDFLAHRLSGLRARVSTQMNLPDIDWQRTQAFVAENVNTIRLNVRDGVPDGQVTSGRSYEELQQYLIEELEKLTDPETGQRLIEAVLRREDLYQGPYAHLAPDLLVVPRDYAYHVSKKLLSSRNPSVFTNQGAWQGTTGTHRRGGILILRGPGVQPGVELHGAKITDVVPTLLYLLDLPLPDDLDGTILTPALDEELVRDRLPRSCAGEVGESPEADQESAIYGGDEAELMEQRLRDLGYVE